MDEAILNVFAALVAVCDAGPFRELPGSFPELNFGTIQKPNRNRFIEAIDPFIASPDLSAELLASLDVLKFVEEFKTMESDEKIPMLKAVSDRIREGQSEPVPLRRSGLVLFFELFTNIVEFGVRGLMDWAASEECAQLLLHTFESFFTDDPPNESDFVCLTLVQTFMFRVVMSFPSLLSPFVRYMADFLTSHGPASVHNFLGLIVKLLISPCSELLPVMNDLRLLPKVAKIAERDEMSFQMFVHMICCNFHDALADSRTCKLFCNLVIQSFFVPERSSLVFSCICFLYEEFLQKCTQYEMICTQMVTIIAVIMRKSITDKNKLGMQLSLLLANILPMLDDEYLRLFVTESKIFSLTGALANAVPEIFYYVLRMFSISFTRNKRILELVNTTDAELFANLEKCKGRDIPLNFVELKDFVTCGVTSHSENYSIIGNPKGLGVVMSICQATPEGEEMLLEWMIDLTKISSNIYEMYRVKVPFRIFRRLPEVQDSEILRCLYLKLYESICSQMFSNSIFNRTIETIKNKTFLYPAEVINVFRRFLAQRTAKKPPTSFFRVDMFASGGIHTPAFVFPHDFSIAFSFRLFKQNIKGEQDSCFRTLVYLACQSDGKEIGYHLWYKNKSMILTITRNQNTECEISIDSVTPDDGEWHDVVVIVRSSLLANRGVALVCDGKVSESRNIPHAKFRMVMSLHIGAVTPGTKIHGWQADLSALYCLNSAVLSEIVPIFNEGDRRLPGTLRNSLICQLNPMLVQGNRICGVSSQCSSVSFVGDTVPYMKSGKDVICTLSSLKNLFPLFTSLKRSCDRCMGQKEHCDVCGALSVESGGKFIEAMMGLLMNLISYDEDLFSSYHFFSLLAEMFAAIEPKYLRRLVPLSTISDFFVKIKNSELRKDFVENFFFNYRIMEKWDHVLVMFYVSSVLKLCLQDYPDDFNFPISPLLPWVLEKVTHPDAVQLVDDYILKLLDCHQFQEDLDWLLLYAASSNELYSGRCIQFITALIEKKPSLMASHDYVEPLLLFLGGECQVEVLQSVKHILDTLNPEIDYSSVCYRMAALLKPEVLPVEKRAELCKIVTGLCVTSETPPSLLRDGVFLPLAARILSKEDLEVVRNFSVMVLIPCLTIEPKKAVCIFDVPQWMHWLLLLLEPVFNVDAIRCVFGFVAPLLRLCDEIKRKKVLRYMFEYLSLYQGHVGLSDPDTNRNLIQIAMTEEVRDQKVLEMVLQSVFCSVSYEKTSEPTYVPSELERLVSPFRLFNTRVIVRAKWNMDKDCCVMLLKWLLDTLTLYESVTIGGVEESTYVICAYLIAMCSSERSSFEDSAKSLLVQLDAVAPDLRTRAAQILAEGSISDTESLWTLPDAIESQEAIENCQKIYDALLYDFYGNFGQAMELSNIDANSYIRETSAKIFVKEAKSRISQHKDELEIRELPRVKALEVFMKELRAGSGPWSRMVSREGKHFKACNRISRRGRRVLMKMNHRFVLHEDAVFKREHGRTSEVALEVVLKYNPAKKQSTATNISGYFTTGAQRIGLSANQSGFLSLGDAELVFSCKQKVIWMKFGEIRFIMNRRLLNREIGIEVFLKNGMTYMFALDEASRASLYSNLSKMRIPRNEHTLPGKFNFFAKLQEVCAGIHQNCPSEKLVELTGITNQWKNWNITTYEYLYYLNILAGRSFCDTSQYPVYPWVIMDRWSETIDLDDRNVYRDLGKSMLALSPGKLELEIAKWNELEPDDPARCLSREMISSSAGVVNALIRVEPFTTEHITLQSGAFDNSDRLFDDVKEVTDRLEEQGYPRESIPEFFTLPSMFVNENKFNLGCKINHEPVDDVHLPPWSLSHYHFVGMQRRALESVVSSDMICHWIDLIFGVYRRSFEHASIYPDWAYPELHVYDDQQTELFGCMPQCLFSAEHPKRNAYDMSKVTWTESDSDQRISALKSAPAPIHAVMKGVVFCQDHVFSIDTCKWKDSSVTEYGEVWCMSRPLRLAVLGLPNNSLLSLMNIDTGDVRQLDQPNSIATCACICGGEFLVTGSNDSSIHVYQLPELSHLSVSTHQSNSIIAISGNADVGIIVSINNKYMMVIETLYDGCFINAVKLTKDPGVIRVAVFKSGTIVVATPQRTVFFDARGTVISELAIQNAKFDATDNVAIAKYYDYDQRELLLVTLGSHRVSLIDVATQKTLKIYNANIIHPRIYPIKGSRSCLLFGRDTDAVEWFTFGL